MTETLHSEATMRVQPTSAAEAYLANFCDPNLAPMAGWQLDAGPEAQGVAQGRAFGVSISWAGAAPGARVFTWTWTGRLDVSQFDHLVMNASVGSDAAIALQANVDGVWQPICQARGDGLFHEYQGRYAGQWLQGLRVDCTCEQGLPGTFNTHFLLVFNAELLAREQAVRTTCAYSPDWPGLLKADVSPEEIAPQLGLFFSPDQLDHLRERARHAPYDGLMAHFRREIAGFLRDEPEASIGEFLPLSSPGTNYHDRERDCTGHIPWRAMELCAFVGLLDRDPALLRHAARYALSMCHTTHWTSSLMYEGFPGSASQFVGFNQSISCASIAAVLDWAGCVLTDNAKRVIRFNLYSKGIAPLNFDCIEKEYIFSMNQGCIINNGRILGLLALLPTFPRAGYLLEQAKRDLDETTRAVLLGEGALESPGYFLVSLRFMLSAYLPLARYLHVPVAELLPDAIRDCMDRLGLFTSTVYPAGLLPTGDTFPSVHHPSVFAMLAAATHDPRWATMLRDYLENLSWHDEQNRTHPSWHRQGLSPGLLIYGPDPATPAAAYHPVFHNDAVVGHAVSCRPTPHGPVLCHVCGAGVREGHAHQDKGAFVLEAFGEALFIDRGVTPYNDALTPLFKLAYLHNLVTPVTADGLPQAQLNPCPAPIPVTAHGDERRFTAELDTAPAWGNGVERCRRVITSDNPCHYLITDELALAVEGAVLFHLHSYAPIRLDGESAVFEGERSSARVTWHWPGEVVCAGIDLCDYRHQPVYHLAIRATAARTHLLRTEICITSTGGGQPDAKNL